MIAVVELRKQIIAERKARLATQRVKVGNPVQRGHRFQRKADTNPVIADSG
jgi:hypothetical protein